MSCLALFLKLNDFKRPVCTSHLGSCNAIPNTRIQLLMMAVLKRQLFGPSGLPVAVASQGAASI